MKDRIIDMAINGSGIRDTAHVLSVSIQTVMMDGHSCTHLLGTRMRKVTQEKLLTMRTNAGVTIPELVACYRDFSEEKGSVSNLLI